VPKRRELGPNPSVGVIHRKHLLVAILGLAVVPSCAFLKDRGRDLARVVEVDGGVGTGFNAHLGFSHVAEAGLGWYSGTRWGLREGAFVRVEEERAEFGIPFVYLHEVRQHVVGGAMAGRDTARMLAPGYERFPLQWFTGQLTDREPLDFHVGGNFALIGAGLSIRPLAILDFLGGFVGIDFRRNDLGRREVSDLLPDLRSADALVRRSAVVRLELLTGKRWPQYHTPPRRDLFTPEERRVLAEIEAELVGLVDGQSRSAAHVVATSLEPPPAVHRLPAPTEAEPASRPSSASR